LSFQFSFRTDIGTLAARQLSVCHVLYRIHTTARRRSASDAEVHRVMMSAASRVVLPITH